jgi:hypothetical protein
MEPRFNGRVVFHKGAGHQHSWRHVTAVVVHRCVMMTSRSPTTEGDEGVTGKRRDDCKESRYNEERQDNSSASFYTSDKGHYQMYKGKGRRL